MGQRLLERERPRAPIKTTISGLDLAAQPRRREGRETPGKKPKAVVLGAGIIGITTALAAQEAGYEVRIVSDRDPLDTASAKAGAVFEPFRPGNISVERMNEWVRKGMEDYDKIMDRYSEAESGFRRHTLYSTASGLLVAEDLPFLPAIPGSYITTSDVPGGGHYQSSAVLPDVAMINPLDALPFLVKQFVKRGGEIKTDIPTVTDFEEFMHQNPGEVVFNCTGLGSRDLMGHDIVPVRGQIIVARGQLTEPALGGTDSMLGNDAKGGPFYVFPRRETTIFGGTTELGKEQEVTTKAAIERILGRVEEIIPGFDRNRDILYSYAGLRPYREKGPFVERGKYDGARWGGEPRTHIDVGGMGGSGWTFGPGAAETAVKIATGDIQE